MYKNALISVSDKSGLVDFVKPLVEKGLKVFSTGGTSQHLKDHNIPVTDISEITGFPEVMGGRVKTLHPHVHMSLLRRDYEPTDLNLLKERNLPEFDLVVVNLYPFESTWKKTNELKKLIENIDIGGPTMLRAAAKNFKQITVVCDNADFKWIQEKNYDLGFEHKQGLARKVFSHISYYDSCIAEALTTSAAEPSADVIADDKRLGAYKTSLTLRYGENPQQKSEYLIHPKNIGIHSGEILQGKVLSYNNILDLDAALKLNLAFDKPTTVIVKHNNPCGVATRATAYEALEKAFEADPVSAFGGIIVTNSAVDKQMATYMSSKFFECWLASDFTAEALEVLKLKTQLRLIKWDHFAKKSTLLNHDDFKSVMGGVLVQTANTEFLADDFFKKNASNLSPVLQKDVIFGEKIVASLKSNAIAIVEGEQTLGLGMGQVNRIDAVQHAIDRATRIKLDLSSAVLVSDAFFPFADSIQKIAAAGIRTVVQPGGSVRDAEVLNEAQKLNVKMILTGVRHFKH